MRPRWSRVPLSPEFRELRLELGDAFVGERLGDLLTDRFESRLGAAFLSGFLE